MAARYEQLGGVHGALIRQADAALADAIAASGRRREQVIDGLLRLVTVDEQGRPTRWRLRRDELPGAVAAEWDAFVARRLLTTDADNGTAVIGVAHEAFLSAWPPLAEVIAKNVSALRARRAVEHAAQEWHATARSPARLWEGGQLAAAVSDLGARLHARAAPTGPVSESGLARWSLWRRRVLVTGRIDLSPPAQDFLHAGIRRDRYRRRRASTVLSVLLIVAVAAAGVAIVQQRRAEAGRLAATARQLVAQAESTRATDLRTALRLGLAAHHIHPDGATHANLINSLIDTHPATTLTGHTGLVFSGDGRTLATGSGDRSVILWDLRSFNRLLDHMVERACAFAADGFDPGEWERRIPGVPYQDTCPN